MHVSIERVNERGEIYTSKLSRLELAKLANVSYVCLCEKIRELACILDTD